jgi:hypothetical protein
MARLAMARLAMARLAMARLAMARLAMARLAMALGAAALGAAGCADIGSDPSAPASIEFARLAAPAVALGDSLRDTLGVARPVRAIVRNLQGDVLEEAPLRYLSRDTALVIDSVTGHIVARARPASGTVQVAARFENALQIQSAIRIARAPDTAFRTDTARLDSLLAEGAPGAAAANRVAIEVRAAWTDPESALQGSGDWLVRFAVLHPENPRNDSTAAVFLIDDRGRASQLDTTSANGVASRLVQVRSSAFPAAGTPVDTVVIEAMVVRRGEPVRGAPVRVLVPVRRN